MSRGISEIPRLHESTGSSSWGVPSNNLEPPGNSLVKSKIHTMLQIKSFENSGQSGHIWECMRVGNIVNKNSTKGNLLAPWYRELGCQKQNLIISWFIQVVILKFPKLNEGLVRRQLSKSGGKRANYEIRAQDKRQLNHYIDFPVPKKKLPTDKKSDLPPLIWSGVPKKCWIRWHSI